MYCEDKDACETSATSASASFNLLESVARQFWPGVKRSKSAATSCPLFLRASARARAKSASFVLYERKILAMVRPQRLDTGKALDRAGMLGRLQPCKREVFPGVTSVRSGSAHRRARRAAS